MTRIDTPFRQWLACMPDVGQDGKVWESQWKKAPIRNVRLTDLIATNHNGFLDKNRVARYMRSGGRGNPYALEHHGCLYLADGHHRVVAAYQRGETYIKARIITI